jgi:hypothetical protein
MMAKAVATRQQATIAAPRAAPPPAMSREAEEFMRRVQIAKAYPRDLERAKERRRFLRETILSKEVDVQITYAAPGSILGIVTAGGTNLNLYMITNQLALFNPDWIKGMPRNHQYHFFAADRLREKQLNVQSSLASIGSTN